MALEKQHKYGLYIEAPPGVPNALLRKVLKIEMREAAKELEKRRGPRH